MPPFDFPDDWRIDVARSETVEPFAAPQARIAEVLANPLNAPRLNELVARRDQVCIAFPHPSVLCPDHLLVPALLHELGAAGVHDEDILLLCASDSYGRTDPQQLVARLGADVVERYRVVDHDVSEVIHLGQWNGIPLTVNRRVLEADLFIATGVVAPHLSAGYTGGAATVTFGCVGDMTTEALWGPRLLCDPRVRLGEVRNNPVQEVIRSVTQRTGLRFVLDVVLNHAGQIVDVQAGDPLAVHKYLVFAASCLYDSLVPRTYDVVIAALDSPYDATLYQAVMGALSVGMARQPAVRPGGVIILLARMPEAIGQHKCAQNFYAALANAHSRDTMMTDLLRQGCRPGEARAFQLARLMEQNEVIVVGSEFPELVEACRLQAVDDMEAAIDLTRWLLGDELDVLFVPHALHTVPVPPEQAQDEPFGMPLLSLQI
jgi:nickel-dependent lactate racemase